MLTMSGLYYVFIKFGSVILSQSSAVVKLDGSAILCCSSRHAADAFYRNLQSQLSEILDAWVGRSDVLGTTLGRTSPQFWSYSFSKFNLFFTNHIMTRIQPLSNQYPVRDSLDFVFFSKRAMSSGRIPDGPWPSILPNLVTGPDWVSGGSYFIRSRRNLRIYCPPRHQNVGYCDAGR
ncbi:hypothetical protein B0T17DRAFT_639237 [Bombardia bombarda]|uniref:Uncharacterized protein n=1 Tax=Bombardia bombarda TaxID=252184 RepID=A0AA39X0H3_9PEZI|nr:hypothetical protein B0T17DRAFT_639237 [Bombardia bombarda]